MGSTRSSEAVLGETVQNDVRENFEIARIDKEGSTYKIRLKNPPFIELTNKDGSSTWKEMARPGRYFTGPQERSYRIVTADYQTTDGPAPPPPPPTPTEVKPTPTPTVKPAAMTSAPSAPPTNYPTKRPTAKPGSTSGEGVTNLNKDCWGPCSGKQGPCEYCGAGLCCRYGFSRKSGGCDGTVGNPSLKRHVCSILPPGSSATPSPTPEPETFEPGSASNQGVKNLNKDCWRPCGGKQGPCASYCGNGLCCRYGWKKVGGGCTGKQGAPGKGHVCSIP